MKTMKKRTTMMLVLAAVLAAAFAFAACGSKGDPYEYGDAKSYIENNLKGNYSITYKFGASDNGKVTEYDYQKTIKTDKGFYFSSESESASELNTSGVLYIKDGDKYYRYSYDSSAGKFTKDDNYGVDAEYIEDYGYLNMWYMTYYGTWGGDQMKPAGTEKVAGRTCNKYTYKVSAIVVSLTYSFSIDKETGVCMKYNFKGSALGSGSGSIAFECTEFLTGSGVTLPAYAA